MLKQDTQVVLCAVAVVSLVVRVAAVRPPSEEEQLMHDLFEDYNPSARPVLKSHSTVNVHMMFSLLHIQDLVRVNDVFTRVASNLRSTVSKLLSCFI